ncbi:MAG: hypothetical protein IJ260_00050 [Butyrivibrio sp.]|nr:hypothetical protein [Butyrivibrio sp.]MBQ8029924.1 hypothetical protein [Butyrivibrio sp.]MBR1642174.1 hypothetical protein [Butyrivibrio sp.]
MKRKTDLRKSWSGAGLCLAAALFAVALATFIFAGKAYARDNLSEASYCSFVIPPEFVPGQEKGLFINRDHPMESSSIKYDLYDNGLDVIHTNREKAAMKEAGTEAVIADESTSLTKDIYQETMAAAYNSQYGQDVGFTVSSFDKITVDGYPGYRIASFYQAADEEKIYQTVYMVLSKYRTFTISMQRAEDDDCEAAFEECASSMHVH